MNESTMKVQEFPVTVYYWNSFEKMIAATKFDTVDEHITQEHFPRSGSGKKEMTVAAVEIDLSLYDIEMVTTRCVLQLLDDFGYRPATIEELCAFSAQHTEALFNASVIALGSVWKDLSGDENFPAFRFLEECQSPDLRLETAYVPDGWALEEVYFLAVKK